MQAYLTAGDVTRLLRIDKSTVYRMAEDGRLPGFKIGRQWRFRSKDIEAVLGATLESSHAPVDVVRAADLAGLFAELYGVMAVVTDLEGRPLTDVLNPGRYFTLLSDDPGVMRACTAEWKGYADDYQLTPVLAQSRFGFQCARAFVRDGFELVAMVIAGGIAPDPGLQPKQIAAIAEGAGVDMDALVEAAATLPSLDEARRAELLTALLVLARHLSPRPRSSP